MKQWYIFAAVFLFAGIYSAAAQDLIIMRDGNIIEARVTEVQNEGNVYYREVRYKPFDNLNGPEMTVYLARVLTIIYENDRSARADLIIMRDSNVIEAKVTEISPTEIRYKRFDNLDGPTVVIPAANVLSIRYENGTTEVINAFLPGQANTDADKIHWAFNGNPGGALLGGTTFCFEFGRGNFNSEINLIFPALGGIGSSVNKGFGILYTFNYFWHSKIGGFYLGGGLGGTYQQRYARVTDGPWSTEGYFDEFIFSLGVNIGYKFVTAVGLYFRLGGFIGVAFGYSDSPVNAFFKPDLAMGWSF
ncbi:MAG: hypothetical protein LBI28_06330 [Treponema sp.]|jgi:hypothetical protein|nr:hypothetical protein [Treponema sp.]